MQIASLWISSNIFLKVNVITSYTLSETKRAHLLPLWGKNQHEASSKIRNRSTMWSSNPTSWYISEGKEITILKRYLHHHVHGNIYSQKPRYENNLSIYYGWVDKENVGYIYNRILFGHKNKETLPFVTTWMNLEGIMLRVINKTD